MGHAQPRSDQQGTVQPIERRGDDSPGKKSREDTINKVFYLKERITSIEKAAMQVSPFRSLSPKSRDERTNLDKYGAAA